MAVSAKAGAFNIGTGAASTTVAVTGVGFQPTVVLFFWSGRTDSADAAGNATHLHGFGASDGTNHRAATGRSAHASASSVCDKAQRGDACVAEVGDGAIVGYADVQSMDSDGFTLEILDAFATDLRVGYLALQCTNAVVGSVGQPTATGSWSVTGLAFQPDALLTFGAQAGTSLPTAIVNSTLGIGAATGASNEWVVTGLGRDGQATMETNAYGYNGEVYAAAGFGDAPSSRSEFTTFTSDGFTLNMLEAPGAAQIMMYVALQTGGASAGTLNTRTDGNDIAVTGLGFAPSAVLFVSTTRAANTQNAATPHDQWSCGAASGIAARAAMGIRDEDAAADSVVTTAVEHDAVYVNLDATGVVGLMDLKSFDSDGFTCVMDDADPSAAMVGYLAFGPAAAGGGTTRGMPFGGRSTAFGGGRTLTGNLRAAYA